MQTKLGTHRLELCLSFDFVDQMSLQSSRSLTTDVALDWSFRLATDDAVARCLKHLLNSVSAPKIEFTSVRTC